MAAEWRRFAARGGRPTNPTLAARSNTPQTTHTVPNAPRPSLPKSLSLCLAPDSGAAPAPAGSSAAMTAGPRSAGATAAAITTASVHDHPASRRVGRARLAVGSGVCAHGGRPRGPIATPLVGCRRARRTSEDAVCSLFLRSTARDPHRCVRRRCLEGGERGSFLAMYSVGKVLAASLQR